MNKRNILDKLTSDISRKQPIIRTNTTLYKTRIFESYNIIKKI